MKPDASDVPSGEVPEEKETPEQAIESARIKAAMAKVEARGMPEQAKTSATITEKENSDLRRSTDYTLGISQDVDGNIKVEIINSKKGEGYSKTGLLPKEKVEDFNKIIERLNYDVSQFGEGYGMPEATAKKGIKKIEDLLVEVENLNATSSEAPEMAKSVEATAHVKEVETEKSRYEKGLLEMSGDNLEYDASETFRSLKPTDGLKILDMMKALKVTPQEVYEACRAELAAVEQRDRWKPPKIIINYLGRLETQRKNLAAQESANTLSEQERNAGQEFLEFIKNNTDLKLTDDEKIKIEAKVTAGKNFWSYGPIDSVDIQRNENPKTDRLVMKRGSAQGFLYWNL